MESSLSVNKAQIRNCLLLRKFTLFSRVLGKWMSFAYAYFFSDVSCQLVPKERAILEGSESIAIDTVQSKLGRFESQDNPGFRRVLDFLVRTVRSGPRIVNSLLTDERSPDRPIRSDITNGLRILCLGKSLHPHLPASNEGRRWGRCPWPF